MGENVQRIDNLSNDETLIPPHLLPEVIVPLVSLKVPTVVEMMTIYREIFGRGPQEGKELNDARYVIRELGRKGSGYAEIRYGALISDFSSPDSKFKARRCLLVRANDHTIKSAQFYFDPNLNWNSPDESKYIHLAKELGRRFTIETGNRLLNLGVGRFPHEGEELL